MEEEPKVFKELESLCDYLSVRIEGFDYHSPRCLRLMRCTHADFLSAYRSLVESPLVWAERGSRILTLEMKDRGRVGEALFCDPLRLPLLINHTVEITRFSVLWRLENNI